MTPDPAAEPLLDPGDVLDVIDVPMCQKQEFQVHPARGEPVSRALGRIKQDRPAGRMDEIAVCLKNPATKPLVGHWMQSSRGPVPGQRSPWTGPPITRAGEIFYGFLNVGPRRLSYLSTMGLLLALEGEICDSRGLFFP